MSSINFNSAATQALRTLQSSNAQLDSTQKRIATGLAIGEAKDNAAYWSISTTLKSDNKAMGTVKDALGLGAATVDTAYQGLNAAKDVLDEIKSKLTAATQDGVDKSAVQAEIVALKEQLRSIASSSTFSGENWLSVDSSLATYDADKTVVASFTRDNNNVVSVGTIDLNISQVSLFDASANGAGILDSRGNELKGGLKSETTSAATLDAANSTATKAVYGNTYNNTVDLSTSGNVTFTVVHNGSSQSVVIDKTNSAQANGGALDTVDKLVTAFNQSMTTLTLTGYEAYKDGTSFAIRATTGGASESLAVSIAGGSAATGLTTATVTNGTNVYNKAATSTADAYAGPITLDADDKIRFELAVDGGKSKTITIDRAQVQTTLGRDNGQIASKAEYLQLVIAAVEAQGFEVGTAGGDDLNIELDGADKLVFTSASTASTSKVAITGVEASQGGVDGIDIVGKTREQIVSYIVNVNTAITSITAAASKLGAASARIELQQTFVQNLMDTIEKGVSGLVDADMNEESTKLQALQVKQQLGVQALSIANQSAQNVLRLFQ